MKLFLALIVLMTSLDVWSSSAPLSVTIREVGLSMNSERVFIVTDERAPDTSTDCSDKTNFSIATPNPEAYLLYSAALTAKNNNQKMRIIYSDTECINNAPVIEVFWSLD